MSSITTTAEGERTIGDLAALIEKLGGVVEQETTLIYAGKIRDASALEPVKAELAGKLFATGERLKQNAKFLLRSLPERCVALARVQEKFRTILQRNMIVLATAHSVSEGIMRRLSSDLTRKASPQVYGASGRTAAPGPRHARPLAVSRTL